jgi:DNA-binding NarL/FixJ family response regulator
MIRVLVVDDHKLFRDMVRSTLERHAEIEVVGACADGIDAVQAFRAVRPDVVLMDVSMPIMGGAEATRELMAYDPSARVVLLTSAAHGQEVDRAIAAGARGYVRKGVDHQELIDAITAAAAAES